MGPVTFLSPSRLWYLAPVVAVAVLYLAAHRARRRRYAVRLPTLRILETVAPPRQPWGRHVAAAAFVLTLVSLVLGLARPSGPTRVPRERATIIMAIDVSGSMRANDVAPTRIDAAKEAGVAFVDMLPDRFNVGLVAFAETANILVPPTLDHEVVKRAIENLELGRRTAIGEAIFASLQAIRGVPSEPGQEPPPARIVLLSDGATTTGRSNAQAAAAAAEARVPVSTIAFGTPHGSIPREDGGRIEVPVDKPALEKIATETRGTFFEAATGDELHAVYSDVGSSLGYVTERREITAWFVGAGLLLALVAGVASVAWSSRLP